jgi:hypothetical protein
MGPRILVFDATNSIESVNQSRGGNDECVLSGRASGVLNGHRNKVMWLSTTSLVAYNYGLFGEERLRGLPCGEKRGLQIPSFSFRARSVPD